MSSLRGFALAAVPQSQGLGHQAPGTSGRSFRGKKAGVLWLLLQQYF